MTWLDITREEYGRWPEETQVLVDLPFKLEIEADAPPNRDSVKPYVMRSVWPPIDAASYALWASNHTSVPAVFSLNSMLSTLHQDCPLAWVMNFDFRQKQIPTHNPHGYAVPLNGVTMGGVRFMGSPLAPPGTGYLIQDEELARQLIAAINAEPRYRSEVNLERRTITIRALESAEFLRGRDVSLVLDEPSPTSMTRFGPRRRFQEKPSRVPEKLQKKRLDGRRD